MEEAEALHTEARRTLLEAREAVRATTQNRDFFSPGKPWGKSKGKGKKGKSGKTRGKSYKSKGKGKGKREDGGCVICGSPEHWWKECLRRGKGKGAS